MTSPNFWINNLSIIIKEEHVKVTVKGAGITVPHRLGCLTPGWKSHKVAPFGSHSSSY